MHKVDWNYRQTAVVATLQLSEVSSCVSSLYLLYIVLHQLLAGSWRVIWF